MAFADFDLRGALRAFGLTEERDTDLFADVPPIEPSGYLRAWLDEFSPATVGASEKARSEFIITPVLAEARRRSAGPVSILSGVPLDVDKERGLNGFCDFILTRSAEVYYLRGPLVAVVEAKREDLIAGLGQCAASMVAVREFNEKDETPVPAAYGVVTSGTNWRFLRLAGPVLAIDHTEYYIRDLGKIVGILVHVMGTGVREGVANGTR